MKRLPLIPTILVGLAVAAMIGLGIWQIQRAQWKEDLLARYAAASTRPQIAWPSVPVQPETLYFRKSAGFCLEPVEWRPIAGQNRAGESGWSFLVTCRTGAEGPGMLVDMGWSRNNAVPQGWRGGQVSGVIAPDSRHGIRLISSAAAPGLEPSAPPGPDTIPNNHLFYAAQWFFFALAAAVIYAIALRRRRRDKPAAG